MVLCEKYLLFVAASCHYYMLIDQCIEQFGFI